MTAVVLQVLGLVTLVVGVVLVWGPGIGTVAAGISLAIVGAVLERGSG